MPYTDHVVWPFRPNWDAGVLERLEWKTDVLASETLREQRVPRRLTPRRTFEASFLLYKKERQYFDVLMTTVAATEFVIPLWHDVTRTNADVTIGDDTFAVDTRWREYRVGDLVVILGPTMDKWEVGVVDVINDDSLKLISTLENDWPAGTTVFPGRIARLEDKQTVGKKLDNFVTFQGLFKLSQDNYYPQNTGDLPAYRGGFVLNKRPDESDELSHTYERTLETVDNDVGIPYVYDATQLGFPSNAYRWAFKGRQENATLRNLLYYLRGRAGALWLPTFMDDFTAIADIPSGNTIDVENIGYARLGARVDGRNDIRIEHIDGTAYYRQVTGSAEISPTVERLTLSSAIPAISMANLRCISYVTRSRLDQDQVEINHMTDTDGLTICSTVWKGPVLFGANTPVWPDPPAHTGDCDCSAPDDPEPRGFMVGFKQYTNLTKPPLLPSSLANLILPGDLICHFIYAPGSSPHPAGFTSSSEGQDAFGRIDFFYRVADSDTATNRSLEYDAGTGPYACFLLWVVVLRRVRNPIPSHFANNSTAGLGFSGGVAKYRLCLFFDHAVSSAPTSFNLEPEIALQPSTIGGFKPLGGVLAGRNDQLDVHNTVFRKAGCWYRFASESSLTIPTIVSTPVLAGGQGFTEWTFDLQ